MACLAIIILYFQLINDTLSGLSGYMFRKFPKYLDIQKICCNHSKIWTMWLYQRVMSPNDTDGIANSVSLRSSLIWVCTVCLGISVRKFRKIMVLATKYEKCQWQLLLQVGYFLFCCTCHTFSDFLLNLKIKGIKTFFVILWSLGK